MKYQVLLYDETRYALCAGVWEADRLDHNAAVRWAQDWMDWRVTYLATSARRTPNDSPLRMESTRCAGFVVAYPLKNEAGDCICGPEAPADHWPNCPQCEERRTFNVQGFVKMPEPIITNQ